MDLVLNTPVRSCCGSPAGRCTCGPNPTPAVAHPPTEDETMSRPQAPWLPNPACCNTTDPRHLCDACAAAVANMLNRATPAAPAAGPTSNAGRAFVYDPYAGLTGNTRGGVAYPQYRPGDDADDLLVLPVYGYGAEAGGSAGADSRMPVTNAAEVAAAADGDLLVFPEYGWPSR